MSNCEEYNIIKIKEGVYCINEFNLSTMFVIEGRVRSLVIDTGIGISDFKSCIEKLISTPYDVVITHAHVDHIGGRGQFERIFLHEKDVCLIRQVNVVYRKGYYHLMKDILKFKSVKHRRAKIKKVLAEPKLVTISEGYQFDLGNKTIEVIETSGHTLGSISLLDYEDRIIFSGDSVNPLMLLYLKNADSITNYIKSIKKLLTYEGFDSIWASHFEAPISKETIKDVIQSAEAITARYKGKNGILPIVKIFKKNKCLAIYKNNRII